ncbi:Epimerase family protein SDR39U1 [Orchesella cincta]|uniref:Epimerase family protein SDR39U1 n=1 Tax=Orchesella cincta TaxID=48709 RepID=A0A1D2NAV2_ORCCI|nr:Epimerase family protein SDR39U1 [Orchesella cincta]
MAAVKKTVLIGGGSGFIGTALTNALKSKGYFVRIVSRKPGPMNLSWTELEKRGLPENCTAVISMAGQNVFDVWRRWTPGFQQNVWASRVLTTRALAAAIKHAEVKPKIFISMSGVGYYKPSDTEEYTEDSPGGDFDFLSRLAKDWEDASKLPSSCSSSVRRVIIRSGIVLGRAGGMINNLYWPFYFGVGGPVGTGQQFFPWIHIQDMVDLIIYSMETEKVSGVLNGVAPQVITNKQFAQAFGKALWRPAFIPVPRFILNAAFSEERAMIMTEGQKVIPKRTLELGFKFKFPDIDSTCKSCSSVMYADQ